ncbi:hypothetical protein BHM03_00004076 [Ensete ventricosum]|nr:hypothetical protein BHM03_00004076 [Ensete ventricosum]
MGGTYRKFASPLLTHDAAALVVASLPLQCCCGAASSLRWCYCFHFNAAIAVLASQKEIEIRNEERDFNRRSADAAHRQHLESIRKIAKLETECQKLRVMVRKRLPGPAALAKMRNEVEILGEYAIETRKKRTEIGLENFYDTSSKDMTSLVARLHAIQDENKILKESLTKRNNELQASRIMFSRTTSKLSQVETQLEELSKGQVCFELAKSSPVSHDLPLSSISENGGNEDNVSCAESWASALISELEHFKCGKLTAPSCKSVGISELSLMDDFVEMEKLAVITVDKHFESSFKNFVTVCNDLLHGKVDLQQFTAEVTSTLDWIINHCFSLQDVADMKETVRKRMIADESYSDNELKALTYTTKDIDKLDTHEESSISEERNIPSSSTNVLYILSRMEDIESKLKDENERLKHEIMSMESIKNDLEAMLKTSSARNEELMAQIHQSEESISNLQAELAILKEYRVKIEDQIRSQNLTNGDLETQLTVAKAELYEVRQKFSSLEVELEQKSNCCEELEATCLELQLQLERMQFIRRYQFILASVR